MNTAVIAMLLLQPMAGAPDEPLAPIGKWTVNYGTGSCVLSHDFGTVTDPISLTFRPSPLGVDIDLTMIAAGSPAARYRKLNGKLILQPSGRSVESTIDIFGAQVDGQSKTITKLVAMNDVASELRTSTAITIELQDKRRISFAPSGLSAAFAALNTCQASLFQAWGYDPHERDQMITPPKRLGEPGWLLPDDYPKDAIANREHGISIVFYKVTVAGLVTECRTVSSSGSKSLDEATCRAVTKRARYTPAVGLDGKPMEIHQTHRAVWRLPN
ncbi:energy transducer TonB [Sphingomonas radiodurans]|uniref:energy transducer TonB n=1 Tax=Sphingomonas radiodurans TaxID=2890321 RepID=UPI001E3B06A1|nr:energy transducer TonB [Sphingomonas radiodurans]WBH15763.1 energy transducer TonB [Sphingomonas radiodurans]